MKGKVLIVEDDQNKLERLVDHVHGLVATSYDLQITRSYSSGVRALLSGSFELLLLDMTIPTYDISPSEPRGGRPRIFGGEEILLQMSRRKISVTTIVVTQFEEFGEPPNSISLRELDQRLEGRFGPNYFGYVWYTSADDSWREPLDEKIRKVLTLRER